MFIKHLIYFIPLYFFIITFNNYAQSDLKTVSSVDTFKINFQNKYYLKAISVIPKSQIIVLRDRILKADDYSFSPINNSFSLSDSLAYSIFDSIIVKYKSLKIPLKKEYQRHKIKYQITNESKDTVRTIVNNNLLSTEYLFGNINNSGALIRGFTLGSNSDLTINSGLRLQLNGRLSKDIEIIAALTDQNTPIQPEGNTERLEELDKVFIQVKHPNLTGTFGDYTFKSNSGEFGKVNKKLQGLEGKFHYDNLQGGIAFASLRGKFNTNQFNGQDGVQGPYRLSGTNNEKNIIVIAGSEKVFLDGIEMKRGEANDYTIEYGNAEIKFTPKRIITSASRIVVDFEFSDRNYERNYFAANFKTQLFKNRFKIELNFTNESDDDENPIDFLLSDKEKTILENSGDDKLKAVKSGVRLAESDTSQNLKGIYTKIDTLINGEIFSFYKYNPGDSSAIYNVSFSYVGSQKGDYKKENSGKYIFAGIKQGDYLPIVFIPLPTLNQSASIVLKATPIENLEIGVELAGTRNDFNRLSSLDDNNNSGFARNVTLKYSLNDISIFNTVIRKILFNARERFIDDNFNSTNRLNDIEFDRDYGILDNISLGESLKEFDLNIVPLDKINFYSKYGNLKKGDLFKSQRYLNKISINGYKNISINITNDFVKSFNSGIRTDWNKFIGKAFYNLSFIQPGIETLYEKRKVKFSRSDSLFTNSYKYEEISPTININPIKGVAAKIQYSERKEYSSLFGQLLFESKTISKNIQFDYSSLKQFRTSFSLALRDKKFSNDFNSKGFVDNQSVLVRSQSKFNFINSSITGDLFYKTSTEKAAKLERIFIRVPIGSGNYKYIGDINDNGLFDEFEFEPDLIEGEYIRTTLPTEELFPVVDLLFNTRWQIKLQKLFRNFNSTFVNLFKSLSTETSLRIAENSIESDINKINFLNMDYFLNDSTTIRGTQTFQQDLFIFENNSDYSFRLRYNQRKSLNQFSGGTERGYFRERSLRIRFKLVDEINNKTELINVNDNIVASSISNRSRLVSRNEFLTQFNYRPAKFIEVSFRVSTGTIEDRFPIDATIIDFNEQEINFNYKLSGKGILRIEIERTEMISNLSNNFIPYEVTNGNRIGKNYLWRFNFDYNITGNLQTTLNYSGRIRANNNPIHTLRGEAKLFF